MQVSKKNGVEGWGAEWVGGRVGWDKVGSSGCKCAQVLGDGRSVQFRGIREAKPDADEYTRVVKQGGAAMST